MLPRSRSAESGAERRWRSCADSSLRNLHWKVQPAEHHQEEIIAYFNWQRRWYSESAKYFCQEKFVEFCDKGYTPYCPGDVCKSLNDDGLHLERAPGREDENGVFRNNLWWVRTDDANHSPIRYHSVSDLDPTSVPNATAIKYANKLFILKQNSGRLDGDTDDETLEQLAREAYFYIFGIKPEAYLVPDSQIPPENRDHIPIVQSWGRSVGHSRTSGQTTKDEMAAIAEFTGAHIPTTPAEAAGGRANQGGYYPHQTPKGKGAGRSNPYPQSSSHSSGSSWWPSSNWGSWSWSSWSGGNWRYD